MRVAQLAAPMRQQAAASIRHAIMAGELRPGQRLVDRELCDRVGVSRATLREAYSQLESEGFISVLPHRGATVALVDGDEGAAVYEVREALECHAIRLFIERASKAEVEELRDRVADVTAAHESDDVENMLAAKQKFYAQLYSGARNHVLEHQASLISGRLARLRAQSLRDPDRARACIHEIEGAFDAIADRDAVLATALWRAHIQRAARSALGRSV